MQTSVSEFTIAGCTQKAVWFQSFLFFNDLSLSFQSLVAKVTHICQRGRHFFTSLSLIRGINLST